MSKYHNDMQIKEEDSFEWRYTGVYGKSKTEETTKTWDMLRRLKAENDLPWLYSGDFTEILFHHEKDGGPMKPEFMLDNFKRALEDCDLHDPGYVGDGYTWRNNHHNDVSYVRECLDHVVANTV